MDDLSLTRSLGDKIADLLEYFLSSFPKFSSTLNDKRLKVYVVHVLVRLEIFGNLLRVFPHFGSVQGRSFFVAASVQYDSAAGVMILKSITLHFPSRPGWRRETSTSMRLPASSSH